MGYSRRLELCLVVVFVPVPMGMRCMCFYTGMKYTSKTRFSHTVPKYWYILVKT